ncbi:hypothetical protein Golomagni_05187 [Golovinomyces magnicellulatus]|nr:hypothetical protein Golomagni_05187 [Golovinomyces magnicellulatus]
MMNDSDVFLGLLAIIFPPFIDFIINICLCILGGIPGIVHAWYIIYVLSRNYNDPSMRNTERGPTQTHNKRQRKQQNFQSNSSTSRRQDNGAQNCYPQASYGSINNTHVPRTSNYDRSAAPPPYQQPPTTSSRP